MKRLLLILCTAILALPLVVILPAPGWNDKGKRVFPPRVNTHHFTLEGQILSPIFFQNSGSAFPSAPATGMNLWISADCVILTGSVCSSPANGAQFTGGGGANQATWADRSANANTLGFISLQNGCIFNTNQINGLPAVKFANNCGFSLAAVDSGATYWTMFIVAQALIATGPNNSGTVTGGSTSSGSPNQLEWDVDWGLGSSASTHANKSFTTAMGTSNSAIDTSWHVFGIQFSNQSAGNLLLFTRDGASDGPMSFTSANMAGNIVLIGINHAAGSYQQALNAYVAELVIYASTSALSAPNTLTTLQYLRHKYGQI